MTFRFGSVCSGIEAASVAWNPLGWQAAWVSDIEDFPNAVLAHRFPDVPNLGDMTTIAARVRAGEVEAPDMLCGGTPCQAFSVAGLRRSLDDERGNLTLVFCELADAIDERRREQGLEPAIIFWENVPGVCTTKDNAFGCFLGQLAGEECALEPPGGKWTDAGCVVGPARTIAWRVLDAQFFALPQQRRRVFVVASARSGFDPAEVLFEREGLRGLPATASDQKASAETVEDRDGEGLWCLKHDAPYSECDCFGHENLCLECGEWTSSLHYDLEDGCQHCGADFSWSFDVCGTLTDGAHNGGGLNGQDVYTGRILVHAGRPRRLTPRECERLMGFPDDWTAVPYKGKPASQCMDGPRFLAAANSWPVPVVHWIGRRIYGELHKDDGL